jgi:hypothetical protein
VEQCARAGGWREGAGGDYRIISNGGVRVLLSYDAWKGVEDVLRAAEKREARGEGGKQSALIYPFKFPHAQHR